jgi:replicative DNA helicase
MTTNEKSIPQNREAEQCLLCCLILQPTLCLEHQHILGPHLFWNPAHRIIFEAITSLAAKAHLIDFPQLVMEIGKDGQLAEIGGKEYLNEVWTLVPTAAGWEYYHESAFRAYRRRQAFLAALKIVESDDPDQQETIAEETLRSIAAPKQTKVMSFKDKIYDCLDWIENSLRSDRRSLVTFGIPELDDLLYPIEPGYQTVIAANTSRGKTALALQAALKSRGPCIIFSLEMNARGLIARMLSSQANVELAKIRQGRLWADELQRLGASSAELGTRKIVIEDSFPVDVRTVTSKCRALKKDGLELVVLDYLQLVSPLTTRRDSSREREVAEISRALKSLAMELEVATIVLSQLNDDGQLRESRAIGQDADIVLHVDSEKSEISIRKQRNGPRATIPVYFDEKFTRFSSPRKITEQ